MNNNNPKQIEAKIIGDKGCYFLSIINGVVGYAEKKEKNITVDIITLYELCMEEKWLDDDCFVERPDLIAGYILGLPIGMLRTARERGIELAEVRIAHRPLEYIPADNEIEFTRYEKAGTGVTFSHFVVTRDGEVIHDPYGNSNTVSKGKPVSKRILTINMDIAA